MNFQKLSEKYDKYHKLILILPAIILVLSIFFLYSFYQENNDFIRRDISLTGGTSVQVNQNTDLNLLRSELEKPFPDSSVRGISDIVTGEQVAFIVETKASPEEIIPFIENYLKIKLTSENSSVEFTGSSLGEGFYKQLMLAILFAFTFMTTVVFFIFSSQKKFKWIIIVLSLITPLLFFFLKIITINQAFILSSLILVLILGASIRYSIPGFTVIFCAFTDILMTLAVVNLLGMTISTGGIIAFLMLIGYSVDTDILLTTRVIKRKEDSVNKRIYEAFKTGMTMTLTSIVVVLVGLAITSSFSATLQEIFTVLLIGLFFDMFNTWITNASLIKWYAEKNK